MSFVGSPDSPRGSPDSPDETAASVLLAEVEAAGAVLKVRAGLFIASGARLPTPLAEQLLAHKAEIMALLAPPKITSASPVISDGSRCRHCGLPMGWPRPVGLVFGDGTAAHHGCDAQAEAERASCGHKHRHAWDPQHSETSPHANS